MAAGGATPAGGAAVQRPLQAAAPHGEGSWGAYRQESQNVTVWVVLQRRRQEGKTQYSDG